MMAQVEVSTTTRTIMIRVQGVPALVDPVMAWRADAPEMMPVKAVVKVQDGVTTQIVVSGPVLTRTGRASRTRRTRAVWTADGTTSPEGRAQFRAVPTANGLRAACGRIADAPGWVRLLWREAPAGVMRWASPAESVLS